METQIGGDPELAKLAKLDPKWMEVSDPAKNTKECKKRIYKRFSAYFYPQVIFECNWEETCNRIADFSYQEEEQTNQGPALCKWKRTMRLYELEKHVQPDGHNQVYSSYGVIKAKEEGKDVVT